MDRVTAKELPGALWLPLQRQRVVEHIEELDRQVKELEAYALATGTNSRCTR